MYNWLVYLHVLFAFLFMLGHGAHVVAMLKFRGEPDPERCLSFFNMVPDIKYVRYFYIPMGFFGFAAAFIAPWWKQGWTWTSTVVFVIVTYIMQRYGARYYGIIFEAASRLVEAKKTNVNLPAAQKAFDEARLTSHTMIVSVVGLVGLAIILWLMRFKPF